MRFFKRTPTIPVPESQPDRRDPDTTFRDGYRAGMIAVLKCVADGEITQRSAFDELERSEGRRAAA